MVTEESCGRELRVMFRSFSEVKQLSPMMRVSREGRLETIKLLCVSNLSVSLMVFTKEKTAHSNSRETEHFCVRQMEVAKAIGTLLGIPQSARGKKSL